MEIVYALLAFVTVSVVTGGIALLAFWWDPVSRRLRGMGGVQAGAMPAVSILRWDDPRRPTPQWRRLLEKYGRVLLRSTAATQEARQSAVRQRLLWAGFDNPRNVLLFLGTKVVLAGGFAYAYTLYGLAIKRLLPHVVFVSVILGIIGFFLPDFWLSQRIKERQRVIRNTFPDVLDLLVICVEAGMALDAAIAKVTDPDVIDVETPLHRELRRVHLEFRVGRPRAEALRALGERTGVDDIRRIVAAFVQTEKLGTSLANTLRIHADASRVQRRLRAEKAAHLAPLKMLFPIVFFLFPTFLLVMAVPPFLKLREIFVSGPGR